MPRMIDTVGGDSSRGTTSLPRIGRFFLEFAVGFEIAATATPWSIPLPGMNKFYTPVAPPPHAPSPGTYAMYKIFEYIGNGTLCCLVYYIY